MSVTTKDPTTGETSTRFFVRLIAAWEYRDLMKLAGYEVTCK